MLDANATLTVRYSENEQAAATFKTFG
jgi:hypothetical protein